MQQVFMNLILNARHAMLGKSGYLKISAQEEADLCVLQFADSGHGMTSDIMEKIFDPFFTTKAGSENTPRAGAGLGLALCKQIIETHGGQITVDSIPNQGTIFKIILPRTLPG
jgi:signal transduction histidine kinase